MSTKITDIVIIGAGPVGLMSAYLAQRCGLNALIIDKSAEPLQVGRADALNARTLQLLEVAKLFDDLYPLGKPCNTSSVWANGHFISRQSSWWEALEGCLHKHFLMLGQSFVEQLLDKKLLEANAPVWRNTSVDNIELNQAGCLTHLSNGKRIQSRFVIGADGSQSFVRRHFSVPFHIVRPEIIWAVIDGVIDSDFPKVPEIIVFQAETSDVAWIPREGEIDRFYVRMDTHDFTLEQAIAKINRAMAPHQLGFKEVVWFSQFAVKESVAEHYSVDDRVFLAGDACHVHSVNGGQGLNTGVADAFNLIWKLSMVIKGQASPALLKSYHAERQPVAQSVIDSSGELVRSTKFSATNTHAQDYVKIVEKRSGNITGMGIRYSEEGLAGTRMWDFVLNQGTEITRLYSLLNYARWTLFLFSDDECVVDVPPHVHVIRIGTQSENAQHWTRHAPYPGQAVLVRPDAYIEWVTPLHQVHSVLAEGVLTEFNLSH
ncbi:FAD-binding protein [Vibrio cholerae]